MAIFCIFYNSFFKLDDDDGGAAVDDDGAAVDAVDDDDDDKNGTISLTLCPIFFSIMFIILLDECGVSVRASKAFSFCGCGIFYQLS